MGVQIFMSDLHKMLLRQLRRVGASTVDSPTPAAWTELLRAISRAYRASDEDRYTIERSLELSSQEYERLAKERDRLSRELEIARVLQTALLPQTARVPFLEVAAQTVTATEAG